MQLYNFEKIYSESATRTEADDESIKKAPKSKNKGTQTDYRDSEAQTDPWEPPYILKQGANPEILTLSWLRWNDGLPVGRYEIEKIKRMRMKSAWEALLSPVDCTDKKTQELIISMIDQEEWAYRDKELQRVANWRLDAMKDVLSTVNDQRDQRLAERFDKVGKHLNEIREKKMEDIQRNFYRNLRKLSGKYKGKDASSVDLKKTATAAKGESYMKFGVETEKSDDVEELPKDSPQGNEKSNFLTSYLLTNGLKIHKKKTRKPDELCIRETRWTDEELKKLHDDLKKIRLTAKEKPRSPRRGKTQRAPLQKSSTAP